MSKAMTWRDGPELEESGGMPPPPPRKGFKYRCYKIISGAVLVLSAEASHKDTPT